MPTKEQLENRKKIVAEVRAIKGPKILFGHEGYVGTPNRQGQCTVCLLGSLVAASMNLDNQYDEFVKEPWHSIHKKYNVPSRLIGWTHHAVMETCGLSRLQSYTLEAVYECTTGTMRANHLLYEEIEEVEDLLRKFEQETNLYDGTAEQVAEFILGVLEASADHPEGELVWFKEG